MSTIPTGFCGGEKGALAACRVNSLEEDFALFLGVVNGRRPEGVPPLESGIGWAQQGPLAKAEDSSTKDLSLSRHLHKYLKCGPRCLGLIHVRLPRSSTLCALRESKWKLAGVLPY